MKTSLLILLLVFVSFFAVASDYEALESCESFFTSLKKRDYVKVWDSLSKESQKKIVNEVFSAVKKADANIDAPAVKTDFESCSTLCQSYWNSFLERFNPDYALNDSEWSLGEQKKDYAEIILRYKNSSDPSIMKMYREKGVWRFGLTETFWTRKYFM